mmetsp:Transcript_77182/g.174592  ORF Transcript_77182/g.174592 Transcript_77182/m.174592 type:complete len:317 (+) Transcript_77182:21-971(+)
MLDCTVHPRIANCAGDTNPAAGGNARVPAGSQHLGLRLEFVQQLVNARHLLASCPGRGLHHLEHLEPRGHVHSQRGCINDLHGLLLRLHEVGQRGVSWLVQPEVGREDCREGNLHLLDAGIDLPGNLGGRLALVELNARSTARLRPAHETREHGARLVAVVVDGLLPEQHDLRGLLLHNLGQQLRHSQGLQLLICSHGGLQMDGPVSPHRQGLAKGLRSLVWATGDSDQFLDVALLFEPQAFLHGDLAEGVHRHLDIVQLHGRLVGFHPNLHCVVHHTLDPDKSPHGCRDGWRDDQNSETKAENALACSSPNTANT